MVAANTKHTNIQKNKKKEKNIHATMNVDYGAQYERLKDSTCTSMYAIQS